MRRRNLLKSLMGGLFSGRILPAIWQAKPEASLDLPAITAKLTSKDGWTPDVDKLSSISPDIRVIVMHNALADMDLATTLKLTEDVNKGLTAAESSVFNSREVTVVFSDTPKFTKDVSELRMMGGRIAAEPISSASHSAVIESCEDCKHAIILEDDPEGRPPFCDCREGFEIKPLGIMKWKPVVPCNSFEAGEGSV